MYVFTLLFLFKSNKFDSLKLELYVCMPLLNQSLVLLQNEYQVTADLFVKWPGSPRFLCRLTALLYTENSGFASPTLGQHISTFRGYRILFSIINLI
jgi:hypothetical protein